MSNVWMPVTSCHPNCGCTITAYAGCCLECPLEECYYVSGRKSVTSLQIRKKERVSRIKGLLSQGLRPGEVVKVTGESYDIVRRLRSLPDD